MVDHRFQKRIARYLAEQERRSLHSLSGLEVEQWFDYWHLHPDWKSRGNRVRPLIALLTYKLLQKAESLFVARREPIQVWALLREDTGDSAVYLHSPNPNGTPFPHDFKGVVWGVPEPEEIQGIIKPEHEIGLWLQEEEAIYVIRKRV